MGAQLVLQKHPVMFEKNVGSFWKHFGEFFCEQKGKNFGSNKPFLFLCLTKKQEQGMKSVKTLLTFFPH
jgi:hypothetical protein